MTNATDAMLPCPFCGSDEITVREGSTFRWRVAECGCGAVGPEARHNTMTDDQVAANEASRLAAISEWNRRATPAGSASVVNRNGTILAATPNPGPQHGQPAIPPTTGDTP